MQRLGLSDSTPRTEGRLKSLLWPTLHNEGDVDYVGQQSFWVCAVVAALALVTSVLGGLWALGLLQAAFFFLGGIGVRERSRTAALLVFACYFLSVLATQLHTGQGFGIISTVFLALLLAAVRGTWLSARWRTTSPEPPPLRSSATLGDKLSDMLPMIVWPWGKWVFFALAVVEATLLLLSIASVVAR